MIDFIVRFLENGHHHTLVVRAYLSEQEEIRKMFCHHRPHATEVAIEVWGVEKKKKRNPEAE